MNRIAIYLDPPRPRGPFVSGELPGFFIDSLRQLFGAGPDSEPAELVARLFDLHSLGSFVHTWGTAVVGGETYFVVKPRRPATIGDLDDARVKIADSTDCRGDIVKLKREDGTQETFLAFCQNLQTLAQN